MDREELMMLLNEHYQYVRKKAWMMIGTDEAEDVANNAMLNAFNALDSLRDPKLMQGWLKTIVENEAKRFFLRRDKRKEIHSRARLEAANGDMAELSESAAAEAAFREMMQRAEEKDLVKEILRSLDDVHRSILYMRFWGGYKFSEISEILNIKEGTTRCMYARCRDRLCERYRDPGKGAD